MDIKLYGTVLSLFLYQIVGILVEEKMNFVRRLESTLGLANDSRSSEKISKILPLATESSECDPSKCLNSYDKKCFKLNSIDVKTPLWETAKPFDFQILVSTGHHDWPFDAYDQPGTIFPNIASFDFSKYGTAKLNVTSLPIPLLDMDYKKFRKVDILIMPYFVWLRGVTIDNYEAVLSKVLDALVLKKQKLSDLPKQISGVSIAVDPFKSHVFICSHRTRDKRCGRTAPFMKKEFDCQLREDGLYRDSGDSRPDGVCVAFINHVGGHKFAANVLIYNKGGEFAWFARCTPLNVRPIIDETLLKGRVFPDIARSVKKNDPITW